MSNRIQFVFPFAEFELRVEPPQKLKGELEDYAREVSGVDVSDIPTPPTPDEFERMVRLKFPTADVAEVRLTVERYCEFRGFGYP